MPVLLKLSKICLTPCRGKKPSATRTRDIETREKPCRGRKPSATRTRSRETRQKQCRGSKLNTTRIANFFGFLRNRLRLELDDEHGSKT